MDRGSTGVQTQNLLHVKQTCSLLHYGATSKSYTFEGPLGRAEMILSHAKLRGSMPPSGGLSRASPAGRPLLDRKDEGSRGVRIARLLVHVISHTVLSTARHSAVLPPRAGRSPPPLLHTGAETRREAVQAGRQSWTGLLVAGGLLALRAPCLPRLGSGREAGRNEPDVDSCSVLKILIMLKIIHFTSKPSF